MAAMEPDSVDAVVSDPPYYLTAVSRGGSPRLAGTGPYGRHTVDTNTTLRGFMGRVWDGDGLAHSPEFWQIVFRVVKPGGVVKAFAGTRTFHNMAWAMEQAGFERISLEAWAYGSGFPKSLNVGKSIDRMEYQRRERLLKEALAANGFSSVVWSNDRG